MGTGQVLLRCPKIMPGDRPHLRPARRKWRRLPRRGHRCQKRRSRRVPPPERRAERPGLSADAVRARILHQPPQGRAGLLRPVSSSLKSPKTPREKFSTGDETPGPDGGCATPACQSVLPLSTISPPELRPDFAWCAVHISPRPPSACIELPGRSSISTHAPQPQARRCRRSWMVLSH